MGLVFRSYATDLAIRFALSELVQIEWSGLRTADSLADEMSLLVWWNAWIRTLGMLSQVEYALADEMSLLVWWNAWNRTLGMLSQVEYASNRTSRGSKTRAGGQLVVSVV